MQVDPAIPQSRLDTGFHYALDSLTETAKSESPARKRRRGLRLYLLGPSVFVATLLGSGSVAVAGAYRTILAL